MSSELVERKSVRVGATVSAFVGPDRRRVHKRGTRYPTKHNSSDAVVRPFLGRDSWASSCVAGREDNEVADPEAREIGRSGREPPNALLKAHSEVRLRATAHVNQERVRL